MYDRVITPNAKQLAKYRIGTDAVYGETITYITDIMAKNLTRASNFVDLGSGIGNVACLMSLLTGCTSFGVEIMPHPAALAEKFVDQIKIRARAFRIGIGTTTLEMVHGDMLTSELVREKLRAADVVFFNNKMFSPESKHFLQHKFFLTNSRCSKP